MNRMYKKIIFTFLLSSCFLGPYANAQDDKKDNVKRSSIKKRTLPILDRISTGIEDPVDLRDPFKKPDKQSLKSKQHIQNRPYWVENGIITNVGGKLDPSALNINEIEITGILLGAQRRVMVRSGKGTLVLKEGMKFGPQKEIELKAILPAGVVFVEKIKNVYNQDEYIETIVPVKVKSR